MLTSILEFIITHAETMYIIAVLFSAFVETFQNEIVTFIHFMANFYTKNKCTIIELVYVGVCVYQAIIICLLIQAECKNAIIRINQKKEEEFLSSLAQSHHSTETPIDISLPEIAE